MGDRRWEVGVGGSDAWGVLDVGRGRWPHEINWNWGGGAGRAGDQVLALQFDKHSHVDGGEFGSETHQVFGTWSGRLRTDDGLELTFDGMQGFAEEARQRW